MNNPFAPRTLPQALEQIRAFADSSAEARCELGSRIARVDQLCHEAQEELLRQNANVFAILRSFECDALALCGSASPPEIANWVIHDSWSVEFPGPTLAGCLSASARSAIDRITPSLSTDRSNYEAWVKLQFAALRSFLDGFYGASSGEAALANKLAMDILLMQLATCAAISRLRDDTNA